jgi:hypothetical protein
MRGCPGFFVMGGIAKTFARTPVSSRAKRLGAPRSFIARGGEAGGSEGSAFARGIDVQTTEHIREAWGAHFPFYPSSTLFLFEVCGGKCQTHDQCDRREYSMHENMRGVLKPRVNKFEAKPANQEDVTNATDPKILELRSLPLHKPGTPLGGASLQKNRNQSKRNMAGIAQISTFRLQRFSIFAHLKLDSLEPHQHSGPPRLTSATHPKTSAECSARSAHHRRTDGIVPSFP